MSTRAPRSGVFFQLPQLPQWPQLRQLDGPLTERLQLSPAPDGLSALTARDMPDTTTTAVCGFCSTGCGLQIHLREGRAINVTPDHDYPVNLGMACPKGWEALRVLDAPDRATQPLLRRPDGSRQPLNWTDAIDEFCNRFQNILREHGPESVAFLSTGQIPSEEMFFLGCLAKFGMGLIHGDGNTRQCMATAVTAYKQAFGFDAPPLAYADLEHSDVLVFVGANPCVAHPILWQRVLRNPHRPKLIVIDPRKTETAMAATEHVALRPKSDLVLLYALAHALIERGWIDREFIAAHTHGFEAFRTHVARFDAERVRSECGISAEQFERTVAAIGRGKRVSFWWTMGVNQSHQGVRTAQAIINLALITGNIGRPGTGANSITGQCNAMGSRLFSNTSSLVGHHDFASAEDRQKVAAALDIPIERIPDRHSWTYDQILSGIEAGRIRGLWIVATNTAHSWIDSHRARRLLDQLDTLVVQDMYHSTETASAADLLLPAAGWGEKEGTFINSERRLGVLKRVARAPGQALSDFSIFRLIAQRWGCGEMFADWTSPAAVFQRMKRVTRGQPCDITGIADYAMLDRCGGIQWPWSERDGQQRDLPPAERRLFEDGKFYHGDQRARMLFEDPVSPPEPTDGEYPFLLLTGRGSVSQWHTETRTRKSPVLRQLAPDHPQVEIHPEDARALSIRDGDRVQVTSRRGSAVVRAWVTSTVQPGHLFMSMHDCQTNHLTLEAVDPLSRQPSYKHCAVSIRRNPSV
ncbi:MAG: molybdopterin oxidoreductase family protein [Aureliella sp.]